VHRKLAARWPRGEQTSAWALPAAVLAAAAGVVIVVTWLHQT
jgi:hypothetical protein